jgi:alpha-L-arabinofuranosidase
MSTRNKLDFVLAVVFFATTVARGQSAAAITIQADQPGAVVSSNLFGIFFEEINFAGEGGIYAEMVRNRSFRNSANPDYWTLVTNGVAAGTMKVDFSQPLNTNKPCSLYLTKLSGTGGIGAANSGFWGMSLLTGATYNLNFYATGSNSFAGPVIVQLQNASGSTVYAQASFGGLTANWQHFAASLVSSGSDTNARIVLSITNAGAVWLDEVSVFPQATFYSRTNGLRADLGNMLAALHPSFMRYPGGNYIESNTSTNAVRWKKSIGDTTLRPGHLNDSWGYWSTDGFGLQEYLQFCEDMGMAPLYDINCGLMLNYASNSDTNHVVPLNQMGPWVQDALDLIQYATGDTNTTWGAQRAANGHPAPFNMNLMEIGNESSGTAYYNPRYALFYDAIKSNYPNIKLIAPLWGGVIPNNRPVEIQDEHYYLSPATFISYATKYDSYSRSGPKVFVGEYAVTATGTYGTYGNLSAALGEAAFMTGMERNSDIVLMASYAPLFANVNGIQWKPDLIYYDSSRGVFGTPSYYVQELFGQNRGDAVLPMSISFTNTATNPPPHGAIGLGSWSTSVQYTNIVVTSNGVTLYQSDFVNQGTNGWRVYNGTWSTNAGLYRQTSASTTDCRSTTGNTNWANYTITLRARKVSGNEGFLILFNWTDDNNWTWWNIGGWGNTLDGIEQMVGGSKTTLVQVNQTQIAINTWYDISIVLTGPRIQCYLNGTLTQDYTISTAASSGLFASSTYNKAAGQIVVKAVNPYSLPVTTTFNCAGVNAIAPNATLIQLTSGSATDENSLASPTYVFPVTNSIASSGTNFTITLPANSLSILRLNASGINSCTNLLLQCASPITNGQLVASTVWGQQFGNWINLTTNASHAISYFSADTNIAVVDINGNVAGAGSGTTSIIATYASLGLSATQTVQVIYIPTMLVHRYSFSETSGTNVADSVGGPAWNGTLPRGGTFGNGQLILSSNSQQYVQLPANILSNYSAVTIETWVTFPDQIAANCFFFGFGNINGSSGANYIFCAPQGGRIAITSGNNSSEQNAYGNFDFSFHTNFHVMAVFNPPAGYLALYTNGVLAGINSAVTTQFSSVNDVYSYIGRSLYSGDPYPDFTLDEFRIYNGALNVNEIAATQVMGPDQLLVTTGPFVSAAASGGNLTLLWPVASAGYTVMTTTNLAASNWTPVAVTAQIVGGQWQITIPFSQDARYYRLQQ